MSERPPYENPPEQVERETACGHEQLRFGSGCYYVFCAVCNARWVHSTIHADKACSDASTSRTNPSDRVPRRQMSTLTTQYMLLVRVLFDARAASGGSLSHDEEAEHAETMNVVWEKMTEKERWMLDEEIELAKNAERVKQK